MASRSIEFVLNGRSTTVETDPNRNLLAVLRDDLGLTGTKQGCDHEGQCGACTVVIDGRAVRSCLTPVTSVAGKSVTTVEGLATGTLLHPLQLAFIETGAVQCGFCTPGMLMSAKALLDRNPDPTANQITRALTGNLCRCTGYVRIVAAVQRAAAILRGESPAIDALPAEPCQEAAILGGDTRRLDAFDKATGAARFAGDIGLPGMHHARIVRSPHAHARILGIDASEALRLPGVLSVLTAADIPGTRAFSDLGSGRGGEASDAGTVALEPILAVDRVRMAGEAVALVVATDDATALAGCERVSVRYEVRKPVLDPETSLRSSAPLLHPSGNLYEESEIVVGDAAAALAGASVAVQTQYAVPSRDHVTLERESMVAYLDEDDRLVVIGPTHQPHWRQQQIAEMLAIPPDRVRVIVPPMGGSFGSRHHLWPVLAVALPAYLLRVPVRMTLSRREVFTSTLKDFPFQLDYRAGATADGRLTGLWARALGDAGPYGGAPGIAPFVALCGSGPYVWQGIDYRVKVAHTNGAHAGPLRGYGMPHGTLGLECTLDELACRLDIDPWDLRRKNAADESTGACTGQPFDDSFGYVQVLEAIEADWRRARATAAMSRAGSSGPERRGAGLASSWYQFGKSGDLSVPADAELGADGKIMLYYSVQNSGQGLDTVMSQLAAAELGLPRDLIRSVNGDTDRTADSHIYGACKSAYWVGGAVVRAAGALKRAIVNYAAIELGAQPDAIAFDADGATRLSGRSRRLAWAEIAAGMHRRKLPLRYRGDFSLENRFPASERPHYLGQFTTGAAVAEVSINVADGKVTVLRATVAQEVGRALNPVDVRGQIEGSIVMELGAALTEEYIPGVTVDLRHYQIPRASAIPEMKVILVEVPGRDGPHGAKGVGEAAGGHLRAAIVNAIFDAVGARVRRLPATPARVLQAIQDQVKPA